MLFDRRVLSFILSDKDREEVVNEIHEYLRQVGEEIRKGEVSLEKFIINKVKWKIFMQTTWISDQNVLL